MILCKSSVLLEDEHYSQILNLSWELLLDRNEELTACAGKDLLIFKYKTKQKRFSLPRF